MATTDLYLWTTANDRTGTKLRPWGQIINDNFGIIQSDLSTHINDTNNPHSVTKAQVGLSNVDNTSDANKPVSSDVQDALDDKQDELVSGTNIKTINWETVLGSGNLTIAGTWWDVTLNWVQTLTNKTIDWDNNTITNIGTDELSDDWVTFAKMQNITTNKLLGRATAGNWDPEEIGIGSNLEISGSNLQAKTGTTAGTVATGNHLHTGVYEPLITSLPVNKWGTGATTASDARTNLDVEQAFSKNTAFNKNFGTTAWTVTQWNDSRLSDSREWSASTISQVEAEAGTSTTRRAWTAQRVRQAIVSWWTSITWADIRAKLWITTLSWSNTGDQTTITGNAWTATALQTARTINGVSFNGTANITLPTVNTSWNQTVAGVKTFSSSPIVPLTPTTSTQAASKGYVDTATTNVVKSTAWTPTWADSILQIVSLTQAEYDAATKIATTLYIITS